MGTHRLNPPKRRKPTKNVSLSSKILALLDAFRDFKVEIGDQKPDRSWMVEQGAIGFISQMTKKYPSFKLRADAIEAQMERFEREQDAKRFPVFKLKKVGRKS